MSCQKKSARPRLANMTRLPPCTVLVEPPGPEITPTPLPSPFLYHDRQTSLGHRRLMAIVSAQIPPTCGHFPEVLTASCYHFLHRHCTAVRIRPSLTSSLMCAHLRQASSQLSTNINRMRWHSTNNGREGWQQPRPLPVANSSNLNPGTWRVLVFLVLWRPRPYLFESMHEPPAHHQYATAFACACQYSSASSSCICLGLQ